MIVPSFRTARAPIRPDTACRVLVVRPTWTIGSGPTLSQLPPTDANAERFVTAPRAAEASRASARCWAACSMVSGSSPASSRLR